VQHVARKYFGENNRTVATLIPQAEEPKTEEAKPQEKAKP